jgi:glycosyltransferase involved in cell wall biosynthesis
MLTPCYWPEVRRGGERLVHELATGLIRRGHRPRLITSHPGPTRRSVEDGLPIVRHWRPSDGRLRRRLYEEHLTHVPFSYLSLLGGDDQVAHAWHVGDGLAAARWSARTGRPAVLGYLGIPDRPGLMALRRRLEITVRAAAGSAAITAVSRHAAEAFSRWLGLEARLIYPPVDLDRFRPTGERAEHPTIFCPAAADQAHKQVGLLIDGFREVRRSRPEARLMVLRPADPRLAEALGAAAPGIEVLPNEADRLAPAYSRAWVSALASRDEAFGLVLAESLACGTPVVGSSHGGIPEIVDRPDIGRIFGEDDPAAVARVLLETLELSTDAATPAACRERAQAFSADRCVEAHEQLYAELLAGDSRSGPGDDGRR